MIAEKGKTKMSRIIYVNTKCAVCGHVTQQHVMMSCYSPDSWLDGRKKFVPISVHECPVCHYTAWNIDREADEAVKDYVLSHEYEEWREDYTGPEFLKKIDQAIQIEGKRSVKDICAYYLAAAWLCDDKNDKERAKEYRKQYLEALKATIAYNIGDLMTCLDVLRRIGEFEYAIESAEELIPELKEQDESFTKISLYQIELSKKKDDAAHFMSEILRD